MIWTRRLALYWLVLIVAVVTQAGGLSWRASAQVLDDSLKAYAVNIVKNPPFKKQSVGQGIYLGDGAVITAAHVVGAWPSLKDLQVRIAGQDFPAEVIKEGSFETIDLALLSVDQNELPISLQMRRNPLCTGPPTVGEEVIDVTPEQTTRVRVISPLLVPPDIRKHYNSLITTPQISGSGVFDAERKCLVGIMSAKVPKRRYVMYNGRLTLIADGFAGIFVSAATIAYFIPEHLRSLIWRSSELNLNPLLQTH